MGDPVVHFEIGGADGERTRGFYSDLFGWDIRMDEAGYGVVDTGSDTGIGGGIMQTPPLVPPYLTFYVGVDDLDKYLRRAQELGGSTVLGPMPVGQVGAFAMFADPDGNIVGLFREALPDRDFG
jgi:predicted enzyme related to lactoylglutathione lyase